MQVMKLGAALAIVVGLSASLVRADEPRPTLFIVGDSTVRNGTPGQMGWGDPLARHFDMGRIAIENRALGGRSSRTFQTEGLWDKLLADAKAGDFVLIQMGHNDGGPLDDPARARGSIRGVGEETREIDNPITKRKEIVHTYGWYLRKYIADARAKGMTPILVSPIPHCPSPQAEPVEPGLGPGAVPGPGEPSGYVLWSGQVAVDQGMPFIDLNRLVLSRYAALSPEQIKRQYFTPADNGHTSPGGAELNAACVVEGIRDLDSCTLADYLVQEPVTVGEPPVEWIDPATGHRVVRLSREPGTYSLYFHQNAYTADGDKIVVSTRRGLAAIHLRTREVEPIVTGRARGTVVGRKARQVFYIQDGALLATHLDTKTTRTIAALPPDIARGSGLALNADETLLAGSYVESAPAATPRVTRFEDRWAARLPMRLFTVSIDNGQVRTFHPSTDWLNHIQFSPTNPGLIMFCHEGPWHKVDRIWTIRADGTDLKKVHTRTMDMEIAGHEFFSPDGAVIWYDLQTPRGKEFWLAGHVLRTGQTIKYRVEREHWSVHYNISPDGKQFAGDGGGPRSVAAPGNGQWIYLFTPKDGALHAQKLVDLSKHDYKLEPNVTFTPDGQWIIFSSNMHGAPHVYAVQLPNPR